MISKLCEGQKKEPKEVFFSKLKILLKNLEWCISQKFDAASGAAAKTSFSVKYF